jgi:hypothetical protein
LGKAKVLPMLLKEKFATGVRGDMRYARNADVTKKYRAAMFAPGAKKNLREKGEDNNLLILFLIKFLFSNKKDDGRIDFIFATSTLCVLFYWVKAICFCKFQILQINCQIKHLSELLQIQFSFYPYLHFAAIGIVYMHLPILKPRKPAVALGLECSRYYLPFFVARIAVGFQLQDFTGINV